MRLSAALSAHPVSARATGEVVGRVLEDVGTHPDVAVILATSGHGGALEDIARTIRAILRPGVLIGAVSPAVLGEGAARSGPAVALWAGHTGEVRPLLATAKPDDAVTGGLVDATATHISGASTTESGQGGAIVFGDRSSLANPQLLDRLAPSCGNARVAGGIVDEGPLVLDDRLIRRGAVGCVLGDQVDVEVLRGSGWRTIGPGIVVTAADEDHGLVYELDGMAALARLRRLADDEVPGIERRSISRNLAFSVGDPRDPLTAPPVLVRGMDRASGALAVSGTLRSGTKVRFAVRDNAGSDLKDLLRGRAADTALAFVAAPSERGYEPGDHDVRVVADALGCSPVAGIVVGTQITTVGSQLVSSNGGAVVALISEHRGVPHG